MRNLIGAIAMLTAMTLSSSCAPMASPTSATPSPAYTAALLQGTWTLVTLEVAGQPRQDRPAGATYTLMFSDDRISARVDCNMCSGVFSISGRTLSVSQGLACTRAACPTMQFENLLLDVLRGDSEIDIKGTSLTLSSSRGRLQFAQ